MTVIYYNFFTILISYNFNCTRSIFFFFTFLIIKSISYINTIPFINVIFSLTLLQIQRNPQHF